jgi:hypothetical protein
MKGRVLLWVCLVLCFNCKGQWYPVNQDTIFQNTEVFFLNADTGFVSGGTWPMSGSGGVVSRTLNGGLSWDTTLFPLYIPAVCFPSSDTGYCGGQDGAVFKTINGGDSWFYTSFTSWLEDFANLYFFNNDSGIVVNYSGRIFRTSNGSGSWATDTGLVLWSDYPGVGSIQFITDSFGIIAGGLEGTFARTFDRANTWQAGVIDSNMDVVSIYMRNINDGYAVGYNGKYSRTFDGGQTWSTPIILCPYNLNDIDFFNDSVGYIVGGDGTHPFSNTQCGIILKTIDRGNTWFVEDSSYNAWLHSIFVVNDSVGYAAGWKGRILKTTNGNAITYVNNADSNSNLLRLFPNPTPSNSQITFTYPTSTSNRELLIHDITGKAITRYRLPANSTTQQIHLPQMHAGLYVARMSGGGGEGMVKFVVE